MLTLTPPRLPAQVYPPGAGARVARGTLAAADCSGGARTFPAGTDTGTHALLPPRDAHWRRDGFGRRTKKTSCSRRGVCYFVAWRLECGLHLLGI